MYIKAILVGTCWLSLTLNSFAFTSPYSSMAVTGSTFTNQWNPTPNLTLIADNTWQGTQEITNSAAQFKFTANNNWNTNWGGVAHFARVPAQATVERDGPNISFSGLTPGPYQFTFNDSTLKFQMEWAGVSPLPLPSIITMAVVGDFNAWSPAASHMLTNHPSNTNLWSKTIQMEDSTAFQFRPNGNPTNLWGAPKPTTLLSPATDISVCGKSDFMLSVYPGDFFFTLNTSNATLAIVQTSTQEISRMTVQGNFIATNNPPVNMMQISSNYWESNHFITNNGTITLRFSAYNSLYWGTTNGTPSLPLPASDTLTETLTNYVQISGITTGRYSITFDHHTGNFTFQQLYAESSGINLLLNPGFEQTTEPYGGNAVDWDGLQAWPKRVADGYAPHSGNWCGAIYGQWYSEWTDYGSFSQDVLVTPNKTYRAAAWFMASPDWTASTMQIRIEWRDATNGSAGADSICDIPSLTNYWVQYTAGGVAPSNATLARIFFLCSGSGSTGTMRIDDAEMRRFADQIVITNFVVSSSNLTLQTTGNDAIDPITNFSLRFTTNLMVSTNEWIGTNFAAGADGPSNNIFSIPLNTSTWPKAFYRIDPLWP